MILRITLNRRIFQYQQAYPTSTWMTGPRTQSTPVRTYLRTVSVGVLCVQISDDEAVYDISLHMIIITIIIIQIIIIIMTIINIIIMIIILMIIIIIAIIIIILITIIIINIITIIIITIIIIITTILIILIIIILIIIIITLLIIIIAIITIIITSSGEFTRNSNHQVVRWFWELVRGFEQEQKAKLLQFVTGQLAPLCSDL